MGRMSAAAAFSYGQSRERAGPSELFGQSQKNLQIPYLPLDKIRSYDMIKWVCRKMRFSYRIQASV